MPLYWCIECGLPSDTPPFGRNPDWQCWACRGPVVSQVQLNCWGNLPLEVAMPPGFEPVPREGAGHPEDPGLILPRVVSAHLSPDS